MALFPAIQKTLRNVLFKVLLSMFLPRLKTISCERFRAMRSRIDLRSISNLMSSVNFGVSQFGVGSSPHRFQVNKQALRSDVSRADCYSLFRKHDVNKRTVIGLAVLCCALLNRETFL